MLKHSSILIMKKLVAILLFFTLSGCVVLTPLQKSKLIGAFHLIEIANYVEAKKVIEEMVADNEASKWYRTWFARGILAQIAYREGIEKNDRTKSELYPDQLFVAWTSFEKARELDTRGRLDRQLAPRYVLLANDLQRLGERHFRAEKFEDAFRTFELAYIITQSPILSVRTDHNLIYNTAMSAYEAGNRDKAELYLRMLDELNHSTNVSHLLHTIYLEREDSLAAEEVLQSGIGKYEDNEGLVILLTDLYFVQGKKDNAIKVLDDAIRANPSRFILHYTRGLIYQKSDRYTEAIAAFESGLKLSPDDVNSHINIATCYYNMGVEIEENARMLTNNRRVLEEKARSMDAFENALTWLDKAFIMQNQNNASNLAMYQLYRALGATEKARAVQGRLN